MRPACPLALPLALPVALAVALAACSHAHDGDGDPARVADRGSAAVDQLIEDVARLEGAAAGEREPAFRLVERDARALSAHESAREARVVARRFAALDQDAVGGRHPRLARAAAGMETWARRLKDDADALLRADLRNVEARGAAVDRTSAVLKALLQAFRYELAEAQREIEH